MLYQTNHHPFLFPFNPFTSSSSNSLSSSPSYLQVAERGMKSVEGALKSSLRPEMELKVSQNCVHIQQPASEELYAGNGQQADDFFVDDLLDFSNDLVQPFDEEEQKTEPELPKPLHQNNVCSSQNYDKPTINSSITDDFASLSVPADDLESLEWLSHFVEDSFCEYSLTGPAGKFPEVVKKEQNRTEPEVAANENTVFTTPVQTKARTKRSRAGLRVWSLGVASLTDPSSTSSSSSTSSMTSENGNTNWGVYKFQTAESIKPAGLKRRKMLGKESCGTQQPRRCSHCGVQKTPQWRAGPLGAKTLCNACGVRFKSGRLLPEYRPACSPTFSSELHSNNHRKVLEMRRQKEGDTELASPVQGF